MQLWGETMITRNALHHVVIGALATLNIRALFATSVVDPWAAGGTSLRELATV